MEVSDRVELPLVAACMSGDVVNDKWDVLDDENDQNAITATTKTEATDSIVIFAECRLERRLSIVASGNPTAGLLLRLDIRLVNNVIQSLKIVECESFNSLFRLLGVTRYADHPLCAQQTQEINKGTTRQQC